MRNKLLAIIFIFILILLNLESCSYGFIKDDYNSNILVIGWSGPGNSTNKILSDLRDKLGYEGSSLTAEMKMKTSLTITHVNKNKYQITFGNSPINVSKGVDSWWQLWTATSNFTLTQLKELFGLDENVSENELKEGYSWRTNIIVRTDGEFRDDVTTSYSCYLKALYAGEDLSKIDGVETDDEERNATAGDFVAGAKKVWDIASNFPENPVGTICTLFLELLRAIFDAIQILVNSIQTLTLHTAGDWRLAYSYNDLAADKTAANDEDKGAGNRDMYTNVSEYKGEDYVSYKGQKYVYVDGEAKDFSEDTEIPVIPVDVYNLAAGNISFTDINFLTGDKDHDEDSPWMVLRNIAVSIIRVTLYLASAYLLTTLIWHGIHIVKGSLDNPQAQVDHRKGLKRFFISLLMLVGSIVIMALSIFASDMFLGDLKSNTDELPIRVNVSFSDDSDSETTSGGYSFSTNFTGYVRYMAQITDVNLYMEKAVYTLEYMALVIVNVAGGLFMVLRMIVMLLLAIVGPIVAALHAINIENNRILNYKTWAELYITLAAAQMIMAIASRIVLECFTIN